MEYWALQSPSFKPLAQPLIRLSAFKPSIGEDKIELARETKEKRKAGGDEKKKKTKNRTCSSSNKPGKVLWSSEAAEKTRFFRGTVFPLTLVSTLPAPRGVKRFRPSLC